MSGSFAILSLERNDLEGSLQVWRDGLEQGWLTPSYMESLIMGFDRPGEFIEAVNAELDASPRLAVLAAKMAKRE